MTEERIDEVTETILRTASVAITKGILRTIVIEARKEGIDEALIAITKTEHAEFRPDTIYIDLAEAAEAITRLKEQGK